MPIIRVELFEGRSIDQKREFAEVVTRETVRILKCGPEAVDVIFVDIARQDWAKAGKLTSDKQ